MTELLEDEDGAPLPAELQRDGEIWKALADVLDRFRAGAPSRHPWVTEEIMRALAPVLWPILPSNDHSAAAVIRRGDLDWLADTFENLVGLVHNDRCSESGPDHVCTIEQTRADAIFASLRGANPE